MTTLEHPDSTVPNEARTLNKTTVELVNTADGQGGRYTFQPASAGQSE